MLLFKQFKSAKLCPVCMFYISLDSAAENHYFHFPGDNGEYRRKQTEHLLLDKK